MKVVITVLVIVVFLIVIVLLTRVGTSQEERTFKKELHVVEKKPKKTITDYVELFMMYRDGIPGKYMHDEYITGVPADITKAISNMKKAIAMGYNRGNMELSTLYREGVPGLELSRELSKMYLIRYYDALETPLETGENWGSIQKRLRNTGIEHGIGPPGIGPPGIEPLGMEPGMGIAGDEQLALALNTNINDADIAVNVDEVNAGIFADLEGNRRLRAVPVNLGGHNVHDHGIVRTTLDALKKIEESDKNSTENAITGIRSLIETSKSDKQKNASNVLKRIISNNTRFADTKYLEKDILRIVWNRINDPKNAERCDTLKENLLDELASGVENGNIVCTTGRVTRMVDTLNVADPEVVIRDMGTLRIEMLNKAGAIRNKLYDELSDEMKEKYINGESDYTIQSSIRNGLYEDYVTSGILDSDAFDREIQTWINDI